MQIQENLHTIYLFLFFKVLTTYNDSSKILEDFTQILQNIYLECKFNFKYYIF